MTTLPHLRRRASTTPRIGRAGKRYLLWIVLATAITFGGIWVISAIGLVYNASPSMPVGWYIRTAPGHAAAVGDIVSVCAPVKDRLVHLPPGPCPGGNARLVKQVVAAAGDVVDVTPMGVNINGAYLPGSVPHPSQQSAAPHWELVPGEVWAFGAGTPSLSYDSRYYGPVRPIAVVKKL